MLVYKTREMTVPKGLPKVFFCCHPDDYPICLDKVSGELLEVANCSVWYKQDPQERCENDELSLMQLFVVPVTQRFLTDENIALEEEFAFAISRNIPVLPLMQEDSLEQLFDRKCGRLQFLSSVSEDPTELSYMHKLKRFLELVLVGDETKQRIHDAFWAYIFLSYRKKDRLYLNKLMESIHKNENCTDVAFWYDEFLTPGEDYSLNIEKALSESSLFALLVTPNLTEQGNYVISEEYPAAVQLDKHILPVEAVSTDPVTLNKQFDGIPQCVPLNDYEAIGSLIVRHLCEDAVKRPDNSAQRDYLIGLAYLTGTDVEINSERGIALIEKAADSGYPEAVERMAVIYRTGEGTRRSMKKAAVWQKKVVEQRESSLDAVQEQLAYIESLMELGEIYEHCSRLKMSFTLNDTVSVYQKAADVAERFSDRFAFDGAAQYYVRARLRISQLQLQREHYVKAEHEAWLALEMCERYSLTDCDARLIYSLFRSYMACGKALVLGADNSPTADSSSEEKLEKIRKYRQAAKLFTKAQRLLRSSSLSMGEVDRLCDTADVMLWKYRCRQRLGCIKKAMAGQRLVARIMQPYSDTDNARIRLRLAICGEDHGLCAIMTDNYAEGAHSCIGAAENYCEYIEKTEDSDMWLNAVRLCYIAAAASALSLDIDEAIEHCAEGRKIVERAKEYSESGFLVIHDVFIIGHDLECMKAELNALAENGDSHEIYTSLYYLLHNSNEQQITYNNGESLSDGRNFNDYSLRRERAVLLYKVCIRLAEYYRGKGNGFDEKQLLEEALEIEHYLEKIDSVSADLVNSAVECAARLFDEKCLPYRFASVEQYIGAIGRARKVLAYNEANASCVAAELLMILENADKLTKITDDLEEVYTQQLNSAGELEYLLAISDAIDENESNEAYDKLIATIEDTLQMRETMLSDSRASLIGCISAMENCAMMYEKCLNRMGWVSSMQRKKTELLQKIDAASPFTEKCDSRIKRCRDRMDSLLEELTQTKMLLNALREKHSLWREMTESLARARRVVDENNELRHDRHRLMLLAAE